MTIPEHHEEQLVLGMFDRGVITFPEGGKTLKSGRQCPYYYNMRRCMSLDKELDRSGQMSLDEQREFRDRLLSAYAIKFSEFQFPVDHVFGRAQAATAPAAVAACKAGLSYLWERVPEEGKEGYGDHQGIEGDYCQGDTVLLADDVITDGGSKIEGLNLLNVAGLRPVAMTIQFNRQEGGIFELLRDQAIEVNAVTSLSRAICFLRTNKRIGNGEVEAVQAYHDQLRQDGIRSTFSVR